MDSMISGARCVGINFRASRHSGDDFMQQAGHAGRVQRDLEPVFMHNDALDQ
jgi:hypothetical protein